MDGAAVAGEPAGGLGQTVAVVVVARPLEPGQVDRAHPERKRPSVQRSRPNLFAGRPGAGDIDDGVVEANLQTVIFEFDREVVVRLAEQNATKPIVGRMRAGQAGDPGATVVQRHIDRDRDGGKGMRQIALGHARREPLRIFLGDEARRQPALAPAWLRHQR